MKTIVLIHGMWSTSKTVDRLTVRMESFGYRVLAPNLPGHDPDHPDRTEAQGTRSIHDYAESISRFLDSEALEQPPILLGHSMGGLIAQKVAASRPTGPVILLNPAPPRGINTIYWSAARATLNVLLSPVFWRKPHCPSYPRARYGLFNCLPESDARRIHQSLIQESGRAYFEIVFWFLDRRRVTEVDPKRMRVPMLVITGLRDRIVPANVVRRVARRYPQAKFVCYPDNAHWLFEEPGSDRVISDIHEWLKQATR